MFLMLTWTHFKSMFAFYTSWNKFPGFLMSLEDVERECRLKACKFSKKRLQHTCFLVNFLKTALFIEHFWLTLKNIVLYWDAFLAFASTLHTLYSQVWYKNLYHNHIFLRYGYTLLRLVVVSMFWFSWVVCCVGVSRCLC